MRTRATYLGFLLLAATPLWAAGMNAKQSFTDRPSSVYNARSYRIIVVP